MGKNCIYSRVFVLYLSVLVSIQNYAKTVHIQEKIKCLYYERVYPK